MDCRRLFLPEVEVMIVEFIYWAWINLTGKTISYTVTDRYLDSGLPPHGIPGTQVNRETSAGENDLIQSCLPDRSHYRNAHNILPHSFGEDCLLSIPQLLPGAMARFFLPWSDHSVVVTVAVTEHRQ